MPTTKARKLLEHGLKDMYDAEQRFVDALGSMIDNANDRSLADGFRRHREVTKGQVKRLETAFKDIGSRPQRAECPAARGLVREYEKFVQEETSGDGMLDTFAASAGLKVEHYEIASYRALIDLAEFCDYDKAARALKQNLAEEEQAAAEMQAAATKLSAKLADAPTTAVAGRAVGAMFDQVREGTMSAVGGVMTVGERAVGRARGALKSAERRGRRRVGSARASSSSTARRATSTTRKTAAKAKRTATTTRRKAATGARRATSTAKRTGTSTARRARATTSRASGRAKASARRTTSAAGRTTSARRTTSGRSGASSRRTTSTARRSTARRSTARRSTARRGSR